MKTKPENNRLLPFRTPILVAVFLLMGCAGAPLARGQAPEENAAPPGPGKATGIETVHTVFLLGNAGTTHPEEAAPVLEMLRQQLLSSPVPGTVVFLGNSVAPAGMPSEDHPQRTATEAQVRAQLAAVAGTRARVVMLPGNQEWQNGRREGLANVQRLADFIREEGPDDVFLPEGGCPGPVEVALSDDLTLVVLDLQWALHPWDKPGADSDCEAKDAAGALTQLSDILERNRHKRVIVAAHHPLYSNGPRGGYTPWKRHLFPLTDINPNLYLPLPGAGSLYALYRRNLGSVQQLPHPRYQMLARELRGVLKNYPGLLYASAHDHSLQHLVRDSVHYVVSGGAASAGPVRQGKDEAFARSAKGLARVDYLQNGQVWLSFWTPAAQAAGAPVYRRLLQEKPFRPGETPAYPALPRTFADSVVTVTASTHYRVSPFRNWLLGENYRAEWRQPIRVPVLDIGAEKGGLKVVKRGGGMQTKSLRLEDQSGEQYVLRSVDKDPAGAIPRALQETIAEDLVQDQISAAHPYAALAVAPLARAAGVGHAQPKLVFVPEDPRLGKYSAQFKGILALLEEREVYAGIPEMSVEHHSTEKTLQRVQKDHHHRVNEREVLRARLFDLVIGDWDRHDDQWRWVSYRQGHRTLYNPVPRDRDQALFVNEGLLPKIASRKWALPKIQGFDHTIRDVNTFNFNARYFDRSFLTGLSLADWLATADTLQRRLTDEAIEASVRQLPDSVFRLSGREIISRLKSRRDGLKAEAATYYRFLAREVDVTGSDASESFRITRLDSARTEVAVFALGKEDSQPELLYRRLFYGAETREIRLYGLDGADRFVVQGQAREGIRVRVIGGNGRDFITDSSEVVKGPRKTWVYDTRWGNTLNLGRESKDRTSLGQDVNAYDRKSFKYHYLGPLLSVQFNPDDGVFLGAGVWVKRHGFRKEPYASEHKLTANYAFATGGKNADYRGHFVDVLGKLDLAVHLSAKGPNFVDNFFGLGNESVFNQEEYNISYYRVRSDQYKAQVLLEGEFLRRQVFFFGPIWESYNVHPTAGRYLATLTEEALQSEEPFAGKHYAGLTLGFRFDNRDNSLLPTSGTYWYTEASALAGLNDHTRHFTRFRSDLSFYWTLRLPARVTLATRFGGAFNVGDYAFFQASSLGGLTNLRGHRRSRYAGKSSFYNNTEVRLRLFSFRTYLFPGYFGLVGFHDVGRVWLEGERSDQWHNGYGVGIWVAPLKRAVISLMYGLSKDDRLPVVKAGFFF